MSDIDETTGRLSPPHLQMLWNSAEFVGPGDVRDLVAEVRRLRRDRDAKDLALSEACDWIECDLDNHEAMVEREMTHDRDKLYRWRESLSAKRRDGVGLDDPLDVIENLKIHISEIETDRMDVERRLRELCDALESLVGPDVAASKTPIGMARHLASARDEIRRQASIAINALEYIEPVNYRAEEALEAIKEIKKGQPCACCVNSLGPAPWHGYHSCERAPEYQ